MIRWKMKNYNHSAPYFNYENLWDLFIYYDKLTVQNVLLNVMIPESAIDEIKFILFNNIGNFEECFRKIKELIIKRRCY